MQKLAVIGASYLQLPLIKKARGLGIETHCFAWADGAVCRDEADYFYPVSVLDKESILEHCRQIGIDGITTIATDIAVPTISYVAAALGLPANSMETAMKATDKGLMRQAFLDYGCAVPRFAVLDSTDTRRPDIAFPVIVKPSDRSGSRGVARVDKPDQLEAALKVALAESITGRAVVEEFIEGTEISIESISYDGNHYILAVTDKVTTGAPHFVEVAHHQPGSLPFVIKQRCIAETLKALDALGIKNGAGHTEIKITADGQPYLIETGARMGGDFIGSHLVPLSTGYDFLKGVIEVALGKFTIPDLPLQRHAGVYFLSKETESLLYLFDKEQPFEVEKQKTSDDLKELANSNDRCGYMIYCSESEIDLLKTQKL